MVAVTESKLYFYITETKQNKKNIHILSQQIKQKKKTRLTINKMQNIKRNHHIHTLSKSPKTTPILIFCTYNQSLDEKKNSNKKR